MARRPRRCRMRDRRGGAGHQDSIRTLALCHGAGAPRGRVLRQECRGAHERPRPDPGLPGRAARPRQGGQRDDPAGGERDEHHGPGLPVGLQQNVVAAAEAPLGSLWGAKLHETRKTISMTGHFTAFVMWPYTARYFEKLPADVQKVLLEEGKKAGDEMTRLTLELQNDYMDKFKSAGVTFVTDVDTAAFQASTAPVYKVFPKWTPGLHETVLGALRN